MTAPCYQLTKEAAEDLRSIAHYTIDTWGIVQAKKYETQLKDCFEQIAQGNALARHPIPKRKDLLHTRCEHHHIFYTLRTDKPPLILAILHERMDLIQRLNSRLTNQ